MKVLVIDDESSVRRALQRAFTARGHHVVSAVDGTEGELLWKKELPELVVLDVLMPKVTGPQLLEKLKEFMLKNPVKVILISAYSGEFDTNLSVNKGATVFMEKPFESIFSVVDKAEELVK